MGLQPRSLDFSASQSVFDFKGSDAGRVLFIPLETAVPARHEEPASA